MKKFLLPLIMLLGSLAWGQASRVDGQVTGPNGQPVHFPTIKVCASNATPGVVGTPTTCGVTTTLFQDHLATACTSSCNPLTGDYNGNYHFYAAAGRVIVDVISNGVLQSETIDEIVPCEAGVTCGGAANITGGNANNFLLFTGPSTYTVSHLTENQSTNTLSTTDTVDLSGANAFNLPIQAGAAPTNSGRMKYDSTSNTIKIGVNGATQTLQTVENLGTSYVTTTAGATFGNFIYDFSGVSEFLPKAGLAANIPATCTHTATKEDMYIATDATAGQGWYFCTATNTWTQQLNSGGAGGAATNLGNLASVAFNLALTPNAGNAGTANADLGSATQPVDALWLGGAVNHTTKITSSATANRTLAIPDVSSTVAVLDLAQTFTAAQTVPALISSAANPAAVGFIRASNTSVFNFRNAANNADVNGLSINGSNIVLVGGSAGVLVGGPVNTSSGDLVLNSASGFITLQTALNSSNKPYIITPANDSGVATVANGPACWTGNGTVSACANGQTSQIAGITYGNAGNTGNAQIAVLGQVQCIFDTNPVTIGDYAIVSVSNGNQCTDGGSTGVAAESIGIIYSLVSGTTYNVFVEVGNAPAPSQQANAVVNNPGASFGAAQTITSQNASTIPLVVACAVGSTTDCFRVLAPNGSIALKVDKNGLLTIGGGVGNVTAGHFISASSNPASTAASNILDLASSDLVAWRNNANSGDVTLGKNTSDQFVWTAASGSVAPAQVFTSPSGHSTTLSFTNPASNQTITVPDSGSTGDTLTFLAAVQTLTGKTIGSGGLLFATQTAPGNPSAGNVLVYADSGTGNLTCLTSAGANCLPTGGGGSGTVSSGTQGQITWYAANGTTVSGNTNFTIASNIMTAAAGGWDVGTASAQLFDCTADVAGTAANLAVKMTTTAGKCVTLTTSDVGSVAEGVAVSGGASGTKTQVAYAGVVSWTCDNQTVVNDIIVASTTNAGQCHDAGANITAGATPIGRAESANAGVGTAANVRLFGKNQLAIAGTTNQVNVAFASGVLTLSLPQNINPTANVTFNSLTLSTGTSSISMNNSATNLSMLCGSDGSNTSGGCTTTLRGKDLTGAVASNNNAGDLVMRGGNGAGTSGTGRAGNVDVQAGQDSAARNTNGYIRIEASYIKGTTYTTGNVVHFTSDNTVQDCGTTCTDYLGVAVTTNGNAALVALEGSQITVNYDATVSPSAGWHACVSGTTGGKVTAQSADCSSHTQVGIIEKSGTNVTSGPITIEKR